ncbi:hypothetical protein GQ43DRAFT_499030 [Delitschia confertaspora ATCC 74209]|uniref:Uncharacterized protein n=1 Tax=Delitschia confertaspora ATCC 74209 TaxID=1513339 RepID=A0A9P4JUF7_9PLEO|nr:hypothetical protein GQ43DRAFT_499030 [Delitschia confertaspora ATCC 74209]
MVRWTPEVDQTLLVSIIKTLDLKFSHTQLSAIAESIGPNVTAKAVQRRIGKLKAQNGVASFSGIKNVGSVDGTGSTRVKRAISVGKGGSGASGMVMWMGGVVKNECSADRNREFRDAPGGSQDNAMVLGDSDAEIEEVEVKRFKREESGEFDDLDDLKWD